MQLHRLTHARHAGDLSGQGSALHAGRWNHVGQAVVYASVSKALAMAELAVHLQHGQVPIALMWTVLEVPDAWWASAHRYPHPRVPEDPQESQDFGADWYGAAEHPLMQVPSALFTDGAPAGACEWIAVINAEHPLVQAQLRCGEPVPFRVDGRFHRRMLDAR